MGQPKVVEIVRAPSSARKDMVDANGERSTARQVDIHGFKTQLTETSVALV
jgi:hypothetical protein